MKVLEPGHVYELAHIERDGSETLTFLRRNSAAITHELEHPGTNTQEVLRALIDRSQFLDAVIPCPETQDAIYYLRMALFCYEARAWRRKRQRLNRAAGIHSEGRERYDDVPFTEHMIEARSTGLDGHIIDRTS